MSNLFLAEGIFAVPNNRMRTMAAYGVEVRVRIGFSGPRAWGYRQARFGDESFFAPYLAGTPSLERYKHENYSHHKYACGKDRALLLLLLLLFTAIIDRRHHSPTPLYY
jgi:hypothetical protein